MKADVIGMAVEKPVMTEASVLGAAMLAAWGVGTFPSLAETSTGWYRVSRVFKPAPNAHKAYRDSYHRYRAAVGNVIFPIPGPVSAGV